MLVSDSEPLPLRVTSDEKGVPVVLLDGRDLAKHLSADGLKIEYLATGGVSSPQVTMTFGPGALALDFDVDLLARLTDATMESFNA